MDNFTVRDLRERTGELIRGAEDGQLSVVTKHGRPVFVALPFDETMLKFGVTQAFAVKLFQGEVFSLGKAAKFAGMSVAEFSQTLANLGISSVNYSADELDKELDALK